MAPGAVLFVFALMVASFVAGAASARRSAEENDRKLRQAISRLGRDLVDRMEKKPDVSGH